MIFQNRREIRVFHSRYRVKKLIITPFQNPAVQKINEETLNMKKNKTITTKTWGRTNLSDERINKKAIGWYPSTLPSQQMIEILIVTLN